VRGVGVTGVRLIGPVAGRRRSRAFPQTTIRPPPRGRGLIALDDRILAASLAVQRARMGGFVVRIAPIADPRGAALCEG